MKNNPLLYLDLFGLKDYYYKHLEWGDFNPDEDRITLDNVIVTARTSSGFCTTLLNEVVSFYESNSNRFDDLSGLLSGFEYTNQVKTEMIDYAVRSSDDTNFLDYQKLGKSARKEKEIKAIGITGHKYLKHAKTLGHCVGWINNGISLVQAGRDYRDGKDYVAYARLGVLTVTTASAYIPVVGLALSFGLGLADAFYGDELYNYIDKKYYR